MAESTVGAHQEGRALPRPSYIGGRRLLAVCAAVFVVAALVMLLLGRFVHATQQVASLPLEGTTAAPNFAMTVWNTPTGEAAHGAQAQTIQLAALRGRVVVVNFWAPWCEPCTTEAPVLAAAAKRFSRDGVAFMGVAFQTNQSDSVAFARKYGIPYAIGPAPDGLDVKYGVTGLPYTFVISPTGTLEFTFAGAVHADTLAAAIQQAQAG
ncbi:MAG TPA: TlpA disulfide reductase family protein [Ktedonobacterales bacterium]